MSGRLARFVPFLAAQAALVALLALIVAPSVPDAGTALSIALFWSSPAIFVPLVLLAAKGERGMRAAWGSFLAFGAAAFFVLGLCAALLAQIG